MNKGIEYYQQAIGKDPTYALAYAGLSDSYTSVAIFGFVPPNEAFPRAKEAALKALEIDDTLAEAHASLAFVKSAYHWDWSGAEREFQRAIALNSGSAYAHYFYSVTLRKTGRFDEAIEEGKRAVELDPISLTSNTILGTTFHMARQYDQAIEQMRKTLELDPTFALAHSVLGMAYLQKSMYEQGIAEFERALVISPGYPIALSGLGYGYAVAGKKQKRKRCSIN